MRLTQRLLILALTAAMCIPAGDLLAQGSNTTNTGSDNGGSGRRNRGNFDPAQFQQRMMENIRSKLALTNDEWAAVQPLVQKVFDARRETMAGGFRMGGRPGGGEGNPSAGGENRASSAFKPSPEAEALQKVLDDKCPSAEVKNMLEKYRASRKDKEGKLAAAQEDLRKVLSVRQEAQAALLGLLP